MYPRTHALLTPDKIAARLADTGEELSYAELDERSTRLAHALWDAGAGWNDNNNGVWPDTLTAMWSVPVTLSRVDVLTVGSPEVPAAAFGLRDYDVQALVDGSWSTVSTMSNFAWSPSTDVTVTLTLNG